MWINICQIESGMRKNVFSCDKIGLAPVWLMELRELMRLIGLRPTNSKNNTKTFDQVTNSTKSNEVFYAKNAHLKVENFD